MEPWFKKKFRRNLVDMHIPDDRPEYMASFNAVDYVEKLKTAQVEVAYLYCTSCVGLCNWPTKVGHMHNGLAGRDIIAELIEECRKANIVPVLYINIWSLWAFQQHPDWRCIAPDGRTSLDYMFGQPGRYGVCCINSPYRNFVMALLAELIERYDFDGLWIDMILWRTMCTCPNCQKRFFEETGYSIPDVIDWKDSVWCTYIHKREEWMEEFMQEIRAAMHSYKPDAPVVCNSAYHPVVYLGESEQYTELIDFISGDAEMGAERSFESKLFNAKTKEHPFEFLCSVMEPSLLEHSVIKSEEKLEVLFMHCLAHNGRNGFIDAIDPAGTLNPRVYQRMSRVNEKLKKYEPFLQAKMNFCADVAIYTNILSAMDTSDNGRPLRDLSGPSLHMVSAKGAARALMARHIPYDVVTVNQLGCLDKYKVLVLSNLCALSEAEIEAFYAYVQNGGKLYVSGETAMYDGHGGYWKEGRMAELIGVKFKGKTNEAITYLRPEQLFTGTLSEYTDSHPMSYEGQQIIAEPANDCQVLARITLPWVDPADLTRFASAISTPPGIQTDYPALLRHTFGHGEVIYCTACLEKEILEQRAEVFCDMVRDLAQNEFLFSAEAPAVVELTLYERKGEFVLNAVNTVSPVIPIHDIPITLRLGKKIQRILRVPSKEEISFIENTDGTVSFTLPQLHILEMLIIQ